MIKVFPNWSISTSQAVIIDGVKSELKEVTCGVPQWSVLRPLEFCNYLIPLGNILKYLGVRAYLHDEVRVSRVPCLRKGMFLFATLI